MRRGRIRPHSRLGYARSAGLNGHAGARSCCEHRVVRKVKIRKDSRDLTNLSRHRQGTPRWRVCRNAGAVRSRCQRGPRGRHRGERGPPSAARRNGRGAQAFEKATTCAQMSSPVMVGEAGVEPAWADGPGDFKSPPPDSQAFAGALVTNSDSPRAAHLQRAEQNAAADTDSPPDLTQVTTAWPDLPEHIKAAILTLVQSAGEVQP